MKRKWGVEGTMEGRATFMASAPANRKDEQKFATCLWLRGGGKEKGNVGC